MDKFNVTINAKDLRRAAFAVGFGITVGKTVGDWVGAVINGAGLGIIKGLAKHGNETAQKVCKDSDLDYETKSEEKN